MNPTRRTFSAGLLLGAAALPAPVFAQTGARLSARDKFEADRRAILAMSGDFHVRFDFRETVPFLDDYDPIEPHVSGGNEIVRVVSDSGRLIQLQHILVVEAEGQNVIVKHWRQDWSFEPQDVLAYERMSYWGVQEVPRAQRTGAWSQTVWQTDDSPRYGGVGEWRHDDGVSAWTSEATLRPLARRDAVRHPPYDHYRGVNRHAITPSGWVHEQQNSKVGMRNGASVTFVDENVINTYDRATDFPIAAGESYWHDTADYWASVRNDWERAQATHRGISLTEEAENGSVTGPRLMGLADDIHGGTTTTAAAIPLATQAIAEATSERSRQT